MELRSIGYCAVTFTDTELSWDEGGANDGCLQDFYRYMIDVAAMDFGANTEHQGGAWPYWWWYCLKMADMYHLPGVYTSLFSYERSASFPHGHRNVFFAERALAKVTPFFLKEGTSLYSFPLTSEGDEPADETAQVVENDTELLYEEVRHHHGISVPHTTGTGMGTDWHVHDPEVEPVVEIFQGLRESYEAVGAPYAPSAAEIAANEEKPEPAGNEVERMVSRIFRLRSQGMVRRAWAKGYQLGVIASSDHNSTHISYAMVYTDDRSRQGILDASNVDIPTGPPTTSSLKCTCASILWVMRSPPAGCCRCTSGPAARDRSQTLKYSGTAPSLTRLSRTVRAWS